MSRNEIEIDITQAFSEANKRSTKYDSYFSAYADIFEKHIKAAKSGKSIKVLEVGVLDGGSLEAWHRIFGPHSTIVGLDINPQCQTLECKSFKIRIGDQGEPATWTSLNEEFGNFDIVIDDGSHIGFSQIRTIEGAISSVLSEGGLLVIEDTHTSFLPDFPGMNVGRNLFHLLQEIIGCMHSRSCRLSNNRDSFLAHIKNDNIYKRKVGKVSIYESIVALSIYSNICDSAYFTNMDHDNLRGMRDYRMASKLII